jgi:hypothetical protein
MAAAFVSFMSLTTVFARFLVDETNGCHLTAGLLRPRVEELWQMPLPRATVAFPLGGPQNTTNCFPLYSFTPL